VIAVEPTKADEEAELAFKELQTAKTNFLNETEQFKQQQTKT